MDPLLGALQDERRVVSEKLNDYRALLERLAKIDRAIAAITGEIAVPRRKIIGNGVKPGTYTASIFGILERAGRPLTAREIDAQFVVAHPDRPASTVSQIIL